MTQNQKNQKRADQKNVGKILFFEARQRKIKHKSELLSQVVHFSHYGFDSHHIDRSCHFGMDLLIIVFAGQGIYYFDSKSFVAHSGQMILYRKGQWQKYLAQGHYEGIAFHFVLGKALSKLLQSSPIVSGGVLPESLSAEEIHFLKESVNPIMTGPESGFHELDILVESLLLRKTHRQRVSPPMVKSARLENVYQYILQNPEKDLSIKNLTHISRLSASRLRDVFHKEYGLPLGQFIRQVRLDYAREFILSGQMTSAEVAYRVGYDSPYAFYHAYKKHFGYPPGETKKSS